jgi:hypothetical protein
MNAARLLALSFVLAGSAGAAFAQEAPTRAQVRAETHAAQLAGEMPHGDLDLSSRIDPARYPHAAQPVGLTRAQVRAETLQAIRDVDIQAAETGRTLAQMYPQRYAAVRVRDGETAYAMN